MYYEDYKEQLAQLEQELKTIKSEERKKELIELIENTKEQMYFAPTKEDLKEYLYY